MNMGMFYDAVMAGAGTPSARLGFRYRPGRRLGWRVLTEPPDQAPGDCLKPGTR